MRHTAFTGRLMEFSHGDATLGFGEGGSDDRGDDDDRDGISEPELGAERHEQVELGQWDENEEKEKFSEHDVGERIICLNRLFQSNHRTKKEQPTFPPKDWPLFVFLVAIGMIM